MKNIPKLKIVRSRIERVNDHSIPDVALYDDGKLVFSCRYENYVIDYINEHYAANKTSKLKIKLMRLYNEQRKLQDDISLIEKLLSNPLVRISK